VKIRGLFLANKSKEASTCRREAAALTVRFSDWTPPLSIAATERGVYRICGR